MPPLPLTSCPCWAPASCSSSAHEHDAIEPVRRRIVACSRTIQCHRTRRPSARPTRRNRRKDGRTRSWIAVTASSRPSCCGGKPSSASALTSSMSCSSSSVIGGTPATTRTRRKRRLRPAGRSIPRTVQAYLTSLEAKGFIRGMERFKANKGQDANGYDLGGLVAQLNAIAPEFKKSGRAEQASPQAGRRARRVRRGKADKSFTCAREFLYAKITAPIEVATPALGEMFPGMPRQGDPCRVRHGSLLHHQIVARPRYYDGRLTVAHMSFLNIIWRYFFGKRQLMTARSQAARLAIWYCQFHGNNSARRLLGWPLARRSITALSQACGSRPLSLAVYAARRTMPIYYGLRGVWLEL